jgi:hypothetical protein
VNPTRRCFLGIEDEEVEVLIRRIVYQTRGKAMSLGSRRGPLRNCVVSIDVGELEILIVRPALHDATVQEPCRTACLAPI